MQLIHPIYLDVPMLVSFAAAMQDGLSFESEVTHEREANKSGSGKATGKFGLSNLISNLFDITAEAELSGALSGRDQETRRELKAHSEASVAILLYDKLCRTKGYLTKPQDKTELSKVNPGTLIEVAGILEKNAVAAVIDYIDAVNILSELGSQSASISPAKPPQTSSKAGGKHTSISQQTDLEKIRVALDKDRKRTPISNAILRCQEPQGINAIITLRTANLRDLTLAELHRNSVHVVGKVTRVVSEGESMSAFENYGLSLVKVDILENAFNMMRTAEGVVTEFTEVEIKGPAVQILPLMIFV